MNDIALIEAILSNECPRNVKISSFKHKYLITSTHYREKSGKNVGLKDKFCSLTRYLHVDC